MSPLTRSRMTVTEVGEFLRDPPAGFSVETLGSDHRVHSDDDTNLVLIDDFQFCSGKITFQNSLGRKVKMRNLWECTRVRQSLLSKRIYLLVTSCDQNPSVTKKETKDLKVGMQYVVSLDGRNPFLKWQMERGLDRTISSVAGESYWVDIDIVEALETWTAEQQLPGDAMKTKPVWRDASFTLKYESDALFDFPHWFGFSKRTFKLRVT
ncbi:mesenteric estrogen-dependent adipogenesis protein [Oryzias melastigma]|uniref:Mesenteric estrogen dependent adipogenesis n=1 Tax=Oryzias melastigma TaxID=30732 RepID=A0A3B3BYG1_ORYME|nr:mesenteric estrogen-dependent adipogenesis protein [Oryzias melastigma]